MIYWKNIYDINIPQINDKRKLLFSILNRIEINNWTSQKEINPIITKLIHQLKEAFEYEEMIFEKHKCPQKILNKEKTEHVDLIKDLSAIVSDDKIELFTDKIKTFIINHVTGTDLEINKYIKGSYIYKYYNILEVDEISNSFFSEDSLIYWGRYFETKISKIDQQHMMLVAAVNDLATNYLIYSSDIIIEILEEITEYTFIHFKTEEELIFEIADHYPEIDKHLNEHKSFRQFLFDKINLLKSSPAYIDIQEYEKILEHLIEWITEHVIGVDKKFAEIYNVFTCDKKHI